jgi:uncharacterized repeat protein (TIGR01451 family)
VTPDDPDPLENVVTAAAVGVESEEAVESVANCLTDIIPDAGILVEKSCPSEAGVGDTVTYTITVTNTGDDALEDITVSDTVLGDLSDSFADTLDPGEFESHDFDHEVTPDDPDPLENVVTATGVGVESEQSVESVANCLTDITHVPDIAVEKTCPEVAATGDEITYSVTVTNTGNEPLTNVTVVDSVAGDLSDSFPDVLGVGESASLEYTHVVSESDPSPLENTVVATGTGADSEVTAEATTACETAIPAPELPVTGADLGRGLPLLLMLLLSGLAFLYLGRWPGMALAVVRSSRGPVVGEVEAAAGFGSGPRAARFKRYRGVHRKPRSVWNRTVLRGS